MEMWMAVRKWEGERGGNERLGAQSLKAAAPSSSRETGGGGCGHRRRRQRCTPSPSRSTSSSLSLSSTILIISEELTEAFEIKDEVAVEE
ncbi:hypothetical protein BC829DRAFT_449425 [Chytridium lagenaria]|nr:hypothetical protein BC829DRAFT_449425 [Chytridium lagenaria]